MKTSLLSFLLCLISIPAIAGDAYSIDLKITADGKEIASPSMAVQSGKEAIVITQDYELSLIATSHEEDEVSLSASLTMDGNTITPSLIVEIGQESSVSIDGSKLTFLVERYTGEKT